MNIGQLAIRSLAEESAKPRAKDLTTVMKRLNEMARGNALRAEEITALRKPLEPLIANSNIRGVYGFVPEPGDTSPMQLVAMPDTADQLRSWIANRGFNAGNVGSSAIPNLPPTAQATAIAPVPQARLDAAVPGAVNMGLRNDQEFITEEMRRKIALGQFPNLKRIIGMGGLGVGASQLGGE